MIDDKSFIFTDISKSKHIENTTQMNQIVINRMFFTDRSTVGELYLLGTKFCHSIELSCRRGDEKGLLAILPGEYPLTLEMSPRLKIITPRLHNVPGRSGILIHPANFAEQLDGCIAPGSYHENSPNFVGSSRKYFHDIMEKLSEVKEPMLATITGGGRY